jgi:hypothetical protein
MKGHAMLIRGFLLYITLIIAAIPARAQHSETDLQIDANKRYQILDGFGVNINPAWWLNGDYRDADIVRPAIDMLIDSLGATILGLSSKKWIGNRSTMTRILKISI